MTMLQLHAEEPSRAAFSALFAQFAPRYDSLCRAVADGNQPFVAARDALRRVERAQRGVVDTTSGHRGGGFSGGFGGGGDGGGGGGVSILNDAIASQLHMAGLSLRLERPEWGLELPSTCLIPSRSPAGGSSHGGEARDGAAIAMPSMQESVDFGWRSQVRAQCRCRLDGVPRKEAACALRVPSPVFFRRRSAYAVACTPAPPLLSSPAAPASTYVHLPLPHPSSSLLPLALSLSRARSLFLAAARELHKLDHAHGRIHAPRAPRRGARKRVGGEFSFICRYILYESCSQFDSLPLTSLTLAPPKGDELSIDIAILAGGSDGAASSASERNVAIEIDGPSHFWTRRKYRHRNLEATTFKHHLLGQLGWDVVQLPHFEWESLRNATERTAYLRTKLEPLGVACY